METNVSDCDTLPDMAKKEKSVAIHARVPQSDVDVLDKVAGEQMVPVTRSMLVATIIREWVENRRQSPKKKR